MAETHQKSVLSERKKFLDGGCTGAYIPPTQCEGQISTLPGRCARSARPRYRIDRTEYNPRVRRGVERRDRASHHQEREHISPRRLGPLRAPRPTRGSHPGGAERDSAGYGRKLPRGGTISEGLGTRPRTDVDDDAANFGDPGSGEHVRGPDLRAGREQRRPDDGGRRGWSQVGNPNLAGLP